MAPKSRLGDHVASRPPCTLSTTILISETAQLTGSHPISIGEHTVLHPRCRLNSTLGPITIGDYCILNERVNIAAPDKEGCTIENYVMVEMNAMVEARSVGEGTFIEVGAKLGGKCVVGKNCKFSPLTTVGEEEVVEDDMVIYGYGERRKDMSANKETRKKLVERQIEGLRALIKSDRAKFLT
ncbi:trimeric LpxA-like protein [Pyronema omphalodes]|nr:trimeric LpxA-like protein [Pyronema omphalodes]